MLSRIIKRNLFTTTRSRCTSKPNYNGTADDEWTPQTNESKLKKMLQDSAVFVDTKPKRAEDKWATLPYVEGTVFTKTDHKVYLERTKLSSEETSVILFPGQGSQRVGMARKLKKYPGAMDLFECASEILGYDLLKLCIHGPKQKLDQTIYSQPAVMVTSLAALEQLKEERPKAIEYCMATAGFGSGEIASLVFGGAIPFDQAVRLIQIRAEAMQMACDEFGGCMAVIRLRADSQFKNALKMAREWCVESGVANPTCSVAYDLFPHLKVIAGSLQAMQFIEQNMQKFSLASIKKIDVNGAYHTRLMTPAVEPFEMALKQIQLNDPIIGVFSNVNGKRYFNARHILKQLPKQIVNTVKWEQVMHEFYDRSRKVSQPRTFICGPGNDLRNILRKVNATAWKTSFEYGD